MENELEVENIENILLEEGENEEVDNLLKEDELKGKEKSFNTTMNSSYEETLKVNNFNSKINSPYSDKVNNNSKNLISDEEFDKYPNDSNSIITDSSDDSDNLKRLRRKYDTDFEYNSYRRSKSISVFKKKNLQKEYDQFEVVTEEGQEDDLEEKNDSKDKFHKLNKMIQQEGYDNIEETYQELKPKLKHNKSTKCLSMMDPVLEVKEEIDFNQIKQAPFKKLRVIKDNDEDIKLNTNQHHTYRFEVDDAIEEDNTENEQEVDIKFKYHTTTLKKITQFLDKSDNMLEHKLSMNYITEEIKEEKEQEEIVEEQVVHKNCKFFI